METRKPALMVVAALAVLWLGCEPEADTPAPRARTVEVQLPTTPTPPTPPEDPVIKNTGNATVVTTPAPTVVDPPTSPKPVKPVVKLTPGVVVPDPVTPPVQPANTADDDKKRIIALLISDNPADNLEVLNAALIRWLATKGDLPERIEQLVMESFLPMLPMEPLGKTFSIDRAAKRIVLARK